MESSPFGIIFFYNDYDFSEAEMFCMDFDFDICEIYNAGGYPCLIFYQEFEFKAAHFFCKISDFAITALKQLSSA